MFKENVILIDADYVDSLTYYLSTNFEKMIGRNLPEADLATWLVCAALDAGIPQGKNEIQAIFVHSNDKLSLEQFYPSTLSLEIDGTAFMDPLLGEFQMSCIKEEDITGEDLFVESAKLLLNTQEIKRLVLVPEMDRSEEALRKSFANWHPAKEVTLLTMKPNKEATKPKELLLGYSIMHALGIKADEL